MNEIIRLIPPEYAIYGTLAWVVLQALGRAYAAIAKGGGLRGIYHGLIFGTNTPVKKRRGSTVQTSAPRHE
jgi:hypothetical protein